MYLNRFRRSDSNGLQASKRVDILEKKAALKRSPGVDARTTAEIAGSKTLSTSKKVRGASMSKVATP